MTPRWKSSKLLFATLLSLIAYLLPTANPLPFALAQSSPNDKTKIGKVFQHLSELGQQQLSNQQYDLAIQSFQKSLEGYRTLNDRFREGETLQYIGDGYARLKKYSEAIAFYQQAFEVAQSLNIESKQGELLERLGDAHKRLKRYSQAIESYQKSIAIAKNLEKQTKQVALLRKIGQTYRLLKQTNKAEEFFQQATQLRQRQDQEKLQGKQVQSTNQPDAAGLETANRFLQQATEQQRTGQYSMALRSLEQAQKIYQEMNHLEGQGNVFHAMGKLYAEKKEYRKALESYQQAVAIRRKLRHHSRVGMTLLDVGKVGVTTRRYDSARKIYQQALEAFKRSKDRRGEYLALFSIANTYKDEKKYSEAIAFYQQTLERAKDLPEKVLAKAVTLNKMGELYKQQSQYDKALELYQQALTTVHGLAHQKIHVTVLNNLGEVYKQQAKSDKAEEVYQQSLTIARAIQNKGAEATVLHNLGEIYKDRAQYDRALQFLQSALVIRQKLDYKSRIGLTLMAIGGIHLEQAQYVLAVDVFKQAIAAFKANSDKPGVFIAEMQFGLAYQRLGQTSQLSESLKTVSTILKDTDTSDWVKFYQDALILAGRVDGQLQRNDRKFRAWIQPRQEEIAKDQRTGKQSDEARSWQQLGFVYYFLGEYPKALEAYQQALTIHQSLGERAREGDVLNYLGVVHSKLQQYTLAFDYFQQALTIRQQIGDRAGESTVLSNLGYLLTAQAQPELAIVFYKESVNKREAIRQEIRTLPRDLQESYTQTVSSTYRSLADLLLKQNRILEAQQVLDLLKVQEINHYFRSVEKSNQPVDFLRPEIEILKKYGTLRTTAIELGKELTQLRRVPASQRTPAQQQRISQLVQLEKELNSQFNEFRRRSDVMALVQQLSDTARTQSIQLEDLNALRASLKRLDAVLLYPLILEDRLELVITVADAAPLRRTVSVKREVLNTTILEFRSAMQNPRKLAEARRLGQQLYSWLIQPIEADLQKAKVETIIYAPDGQLRYIPLSALHDGKQWLVERYRVNNITAKSLMGDRFEAQRPIQPRALAGAFADNTASYSVKVGERSFSFSGLPYARQEVANLAAKLPGTQQLVDKAFSLAVVEPRMNEHNILHFATHAAFVTGQPEDSFIVFGDGKTVTLRDIENWSLQNVDLVVLSACETGLGGKLGNGEEILGLGYRFQDRGAKAAIASLWKVKDDSTSMLMTAFYTELGQGRSKVEALRQAQIRLIQHGNYQHPLYWAPFVLIGNGL